MAESRYLVSTPEPVNVACLPVLAPVVEPCWNPSTSVVHPDIVGLDPRLDQGADERVHGLYQSIDDVVAVVTAAGIVEIDLDGDLLARRVTRQQRGPGPIHGTDTGEFQQALLHHLVHNTLLDARPIPFRLEIPGRG